ncbi:phosphotransferase family protein [Alicyclobacillus acidoterrestris]|uniref:phosphotransferase family protein n=1 Tax=Alicyclobacillus acidoterrestris TaxID=1450 RepID=UPI003F530EAB
MDPKYRDYISLIQAQVPELELLQVEVNNIGWDNLIFIINQEWIFRFPRTEELTQRVEQEQRLLEYLYNRTRMSNIRIPLYQLLKNQDNQVAGCYYRMIPGIPLTPISMRRMNHQTRKNIAKELGIFLKNLHTSNIQILKTYGYRTVHTRQYWENHLQEITEYIVTDIA